MSKGKKLAIAASVAVSLMLTCCCGLAWFGSTLPPPPPRTATVTPEPPTGGTLPTASPTPPPVAPAAQPAAVPDPENAPVPTPAPAEVPPPVAPAPAAPPAPVTATPPVPAVAAPPPPVPTPPPVVAAPPPPTWRNPATCVADFTRLANPATDWLTAACAWSNVRTPGERSSVAETIYELVESADPPREARGFVRDAMNELINSSTLIRRFDPFLLPTPAHLTELRTELERQIELCPRCSRIAPGFAYLDSVKYWLGHYPTTVDSVQTYQLRHDELREQTAIVTGFVTASDYYNCKYRSTSTWRSMTFSDRGDAFAALEAMHVYCRAGEPYCDSIYSAAVQAARTRRGIPVQLMLTYPRSNQVCEADQSEVVAVQRQDRR